MSGCRRSATACAARSSPRRGRTSTSTPPSSSAKILFEKLELTPQKKTKTGFSTDAASLEKLLGQHPIIEHLLAYREVENTVAEQYGR